MYAKRTEIVDDNDFPLVILKAFHDEDSDDASFKMITQGIALSIDMPPNASKDTYCKSLIDIAQEIVAFAKYLRTA